MNHRRLKELVLERDQECVEHKRMPAHVCRDHQGRPHGPDVRELLTLEHIKPELAMGKRKLNEPRWCIALCWAVNLQPPTKEQRAWYRDYLSSLTSPPSSPPTS